MEGEYEASEKMKEDASKEGLSANEKPAKSSLINPKDFDAASEDEKRASEYQLTYLGVRWAKMAVIVPTLVTMLIAVGVFSWVTHLVENAIQDTKANIISESEFNSLISIFLTKSSQIDQETRKELADALESRKYYATIKILDTVVDGVGDEFIRKGNLTYFRALTKLMVKEFPSSFEDFRTAYSFYQDGRLQHQNTIRNTVVGMVKLKESGFVDESDFSFINEAVEYVELTNIQWRFSEMEEWK